MDTKVSEKHAAFILRDFKPDDGGSTVLYSMTTQKNTRMLTIYAQS
jgi:hypothetical protein